MGPKGKEMMKIGLGCIFYQCYTELERLINSIPKGFVDIFIGIDGIYRYLKEQNPSLPDVSNDGSKNLILSSTDKFIPLLMNKPHCTEFEKRNKYLEICDRMVGDLDVLIIVDSDEYFLFPEGVEPELAFSRFKNNMEVVMSKSQGHNVFSIHTLDVQNNYNSHKPRIWRNPGEMRYTNGSHYHYANIYKEKETIDTFKLNRVNYCQHTEGVIKGIVMAHDHNLRSAHQTKVHDNYLEYLNRFEGLTQSYYFDIEQSHKLASQGVTRNEINIKNKDEYIKQVT